MFENLFFFPLIFSNKQYEYDKTFDDWTPGGQTFDTRCHRQISDKCYNSGNKFCWDWQTAILHRSLTVAFIQSQNYIRAFEGNREADVAPGEKEFDTPAEGDWALTF